MGHSDARTFFGEVILGLARLSPCLRGGYKSRTRTLSDWGLVLWLNASDFGSGNCLLNTNDIAQVKYPSFDHTSVLGEIPDEEKRNRYTRFYE